MSLTLPPLKRCKLTASSTPAATIPRDIIGKEILPKLPVKSLIRFTSVCKSWRSIIRSRSFQKLQFDYSKNKSNWYDIFTIPLYLDLFGYNGRNEVDEFIGCSNGLCCFIMVDNKVLLYNPSSRKFRIIKDVPCSPNAYGFGYDSVRDDYKFVKCTLFSKYTSKSTAEVHIYSMRTDSWSRLSFQLPYPVPSSGHRRAFFANGVLYWLCTRSYGNNFFTTFDLEHQQFGRVQVPAALQDLDFDFQLMSDGGDSIYACPNRGSRARCDVWAKQGENQEWVSSDQPIAYFRISGVKWPKPFLGRPGACMEDREARSYTPRDLCTHRVVGLAHHFENLLLPEDNQLEGPSPGTT